MDASVRKTSACRVRRKRVVPIPRCRDQPLGQEPGGTVARSPAHRGEHAIRRKAIAQGMSDVSAALSLLACAKCSFLCTQELRVRPAPGIPCALSHREGHEPHQLGAHAACERADACRWCAQPWGSSQWTSAVCKRTGCLPGRPNPAANCRNWTRRRPVLGCASSVAGRHEPHAP
jgi:hypothetical protein